MDWKHISEEPKQKNRPILFVQLDNKIGAVKEYIADDYATVLEFKAIEMKHSFTHWTYFNMPKCKCGDLLEHYTNLQVGKCDSCFTTNA